MDYEEFIQKWALPVILGKRYTTYEESYHGLRMKTLAERRKTLATKFSLKKIASTLDTINGLLKPKMLVVLEEQKKHDKKPAF